MNRKEYYEEIELSIRNLSSARDFKGYLFNNYKNQLFAWRLGAEFKRTYNEDYIWSKALLLSSNAVILLRYDAQNGHALKALKECAEVYEYFHEIAEKYDKGYCAILSALCYDIVGYQANALCMMRQVQKYEYEKQDLDNGLSTDNHILFHIQQILLKKLPFAYYQNPEYLKDAELGLTLFDSAIKKFLKNALSGEETNFSESLYETYIYFLQSGNVHISHLLFLLLLRLEKYKERSIWINLQKANKTASPIWQKYIRLLTNDIYDQFRVKEPIERISRFEFWISQLKAIEQRIVTSSESFVVQMPTSTGKTFIAELAILDSLVQHTNKKCVYVAPFRALTNEIEYELSRNLSKVGYAVSTLSGNYEIDEYNDVLLDETDVLVATPEKIDFLFRTSSAFFDNVSLLVIDEGHIIGNLDDRSSLLEFLIIRLKRKIKDLRILFISAVMPELNAQDFSEWISQKRTNVIAPPKYIDNLEWQPTRKVIGKFNWQKTLGTIDYPRIELEEEKSKKKIRTFAPGIIRQELIEYVNPATGRVNRVRFPNTGNKSETAAQLAYKFSEKGNCLVFCSRPDWAKSVGKAFLGLINLYQISQRPLLSGFDENLSSESYFLSTKWFGKTSVITECLKRGIGIHYGPMAEPVRRAIENDFRNGILRILISTNTIGQGLNFPIRNLIFHSVEINPQREHYRAITVRDFWNIVGRAGRAGRETEGQVIFISLNQNDENLFAKYTNMDNLEAAKSILHLVLNAFITKRLSEDQFQGFLEQLSETYILNTLVEETIGTDDEKIINEIIDNSLFKVQSLSLDLTPITTGFKKIFAKIHSATQDPNVRQTFSKTGFSLMANKTIAAYVDENKEQLQKVLGNDDYMSLLKLILECFKKNKFREMRFDDHLDDIEESNITDFIASWLEGSSVEDLRKLWESKAAANISDKMDEFIGKGLYYRYPWGITAFLLILSNNMNIEYDKLPLNIRNLATFVKFGLNNQIACFASSLGIKNRELALRLSKEYGGLQNYKPFAYWLSNITVEDISKWKLNRFDRANVLEVALKLNTNRFRKEIPKSFEFYVRGIFYEKNRQESSKLVKVGDRLRYERDFINEYDPFAIGIYKGEQMLGFVPREFSRTISTEIDINDKRYVSEVIEIKKKKEFHEIKLEMREA